MFLSQSFANTHSTKALRDYFALAESQPTPATLCQGKDVTTEKEPTNYVQHAPLLLMLILQPL